MNKSIHTILISIMMLAFSSCKKEVVTELPLEEEKVVRILADMHFAKSAAMVHKAEIRDSMKLVYESQVFTINEITRSQYDDLKQKLESNLKLYYDIEKKVHIYLKDVQNEINK